MRLKANVATLMLTMVVVAGFAPVSDTRERRRLGGPLEERCAAAERFLVEDQGMVAVTEPDTIDDWRTRKTLPGCRVTAAGTTTLHLSTEADLFYQRLRAAGWIRTPTPIDAPNEASLRFRLGETDCLFNIYSGILLGTAAEIEVSNARVPDFGETRYNVLVLCIPAMEAAPRS